MQVLMTVSKQSQDVPVRIIGLILFHVLANKPNSRIGKKHVVSKTDIYLIKSNHNFLNLWNTWRACHPLLNEMRY
jgi:hypothetical protein